MDYSSLLVQIVNQLYFLNQKGINYININELSDLHLKSLINGLEELNSKYNVISNVTHEKKPKEKTDKYENNLEANNEIGLRTEQTNIIDQTEIIDLEPNVTNQTFAQRKNSQRSTNKFLFLSEIFEKYKSCQKCSLGQTRKNLVFGRGLSNPPIMFIGEGPGADEDALGEPFVGRAGRLLTKMINAIGIERNDVYITNIVKCRPPGNRNPTPAEISCCLPITKQQIEILNPKLIVTLGNIPTKTLIPDVPGITKARGKIKQYEKWTVLPTFHPSYLLRNRSAMPQAWEDFKKITEFTFNSTQG